MNVVASAAPCFLGRLPRGGTADVGTCRSNLHQKLWPSEAPGKALPRNRRPKALAVSCTNNPLGPKEVLVFHVLNIEEDRLFPPPLHRSHVKQGAARVLGQRVSLRTGFQQNQASRCSELWLLPLGCTYQKKKKKAIPVHLELRDFEILCLFLRWKLAMDIPVC